MADSTSGPVGVVHVTLRVGPPTASHVKLRGLPWETLVEGLAVRSTITGATTDIRGGGGERRGRGGGGEGQRLEGKSHYKTVIQLW